jgi:uncharacterized protein (DUF4415 family)
MQNEIKALENMPDSEIDFSDIPEMGEEFFKNAVIGKFYRPIKKPITIRLDADVLQWFKHEGKGYQSKINEVLRHHMQQKSF